MFYYINGSIAEKWISLLQRLPHGSGIDCTWQFYDQGSYLKAENSYHCLNGNGYYDGYADFSLIIPKADPSSFRLHFHNSPSHYKARRYFLREYLEETFHYSLTQEEILR